VATKKRETRSSKSSPSRARTKPRKAEELSRETRLIKALAHPMRVTILEIMSTGEWSPNELKTALGEGLSQVSYHVKVLHDLEMIELTKTEPRRGAVEHFYRAVERAFLSSADASDVPKTQQSIIGGNILEKIAKDAATSLKAGTFFKRDDWNVGWYPADLDDQGCRDAEKLANRFIEDFIRIEAESVNRRAESKDGGEHIWVTAVSLVFGSTEGPMGGVPAKEGT
jgi:DNA-binding transcriptional ArsR family regulator